MPKNIECLFSPGDLLPTCYLTKVPKRHSHDALYSRFLTTFRAIIKANTSFEFKKFTRFLFWKAPLLDIFGNPHILPKTSQLLLITHLYHIATHILMNLL